MPRNVTGGSGHKARSNTEHPKAVSNRRLINDYLDDCRNNDVEEGLYVGRVLRKLGSGRLEVFYTKKEKGRVKEVTENMPLDVSLKRSLYAVPIDMDVVVLLTETGLGGREREIIAAFSPEQVQKYKELCPDADHRIFLKSGEEEEDTGAGIMFDRSDEPEQKEEAIVRPAKKMEPPKPKTVLTKKQEKDDDGDDDVNIDDI